MLYLTKTFNINSRKDYLEIDIYGDSHLGSKSTNEEKIKEDIKDTEKYNRLWCHVGDVVDGILPRDRRFQSRNLAGWAWDALKDNQLIRAEWERFEELFEPIQKNCLFVLMGDGKHHATKDVSDEMDRTLHNMGIAQRIKNRNGLFISPSLYYRFKFLRMTGKDKETPSGTKKIDVAFHHGYFAGRTNSSKVINLERALRRFPEARAFACGHGHVKNETRLNGMAYDGDIQKMVRIVRRAAMTGSYYDTYREDTIGYGDIKGYDPDGFGKITLVISPYSTNPEKVVEFKNI